MYPIFKGMLLNVSFPISIQISLKYVSMGTIDSKASLV